MGRAIIFFIATCISISGKHCDAIDINFVDFLNSTMISNIINVLSEDLKIFNPMNNPGLSSLIIDNSEFNEDIFLNFTQLVKKYGYEVETHEVKTEDEYLLTVFRIKRSGPPVLLVHGGASSSDDFITIGPQAGLPYLLADAGYDVWLINNRGTKHSLRHVNLTTESAAFWDYTIDEVGRYDLPATIDYIQQISSNQKVKVIAHSAGTTESFILCSERPEYNDKISVLIMLSPIVSLRHTHSTFSRLGAYIFTSEVVSFLESLGIYSLGLSSETQMQVGALFCGTPVTATAFCYNLVALIFGPDYEQINSTSLPVIFSHFPTSGSLKSLAHTYQLVRQDKFRKYDYGLMGNLIKYGTTIPPAYPLEKITTNVILYRADNDWLSVDEDVQALTKLSNAKEVRVPFMKFCHSDYVFARDVKSLVYDDIILMLPSY